MSTRRLTLTAAEAGALLVGTLAFVAGLVVGVVVGVGARARAVPPPAAVQVHCGDTP